jgi:hypothetical protein
MCDKLASKGIPNKRDENDPSRFNNLNIDDYIEGKSKEVEFDSVKKHHWTSGKDEEAFSVSWNTSKRTFLKTSWHGWNFDGENKWYPIGYEASA